MQWYIFGVLALVLSFTNAQQLAGIKRNYGPYSAAEESNSVEDAAWTEQSGVVKRDVGAELEISNLFAGGIQVFKQVPYLEVLKLVESFLKLKGEVAGRVWDLITDNEHIFKAIRQTLIANIGAMHKLTLTFVVILRKILEFAANVFGNANFGVNFG